MKRKSPMRRAQLRKRATRWARGAGTHIVRPTVNRFVDEVNGAIRAIFN